MSENKQSSDIQLFKDPDNLAQLYVLVGKSGRGKSHLIKYLVYNGVENYGWKFGLCFVKTKFNGDYSYLPDSKVFEGYNERVLQRYIENLKQMKRKGKQIPPNFVIMDDLVGVLQSQTPWFSNFISVFRHTNTNVLISVQYLTGKHAVPPIIREQTNYAIMFRSKTRRTLEKLYGNFGQLFETIQEFKDQFMHATSEKYEAMLYIEREDEIENNYLTIKAPKDLPNWKLKY